MIAGDTLILGASSSIGRKLIENVIGEEGKILAHYNSSDESLKEFAKLGKNKFIQVQANLSEVKDAEKILDAVSAENLNITKIVHLAAPPLQMGMFKMTTAEEFNLNWNVQVLTASEILKRTTPNMVKNKKGKIVFMLSSVTTGKVPAGMMAYVTGKFAMLGLMQALAAEYITKGINVNGVSPSMMETDFLRHVPAQLVESSATQSPLKRNAKTEDVVPLIKMLLSSDSDYLSGVNIPISGGQ
jgi:3-oxoacyl-[acyl-carrier protein] reductase